MHSSFRGKHRSTMLYFILQQANWLPINPQCFTYSILTCCWNTSAYRGADTHVKSACMWACMQTLSTLIAGFVFYCKCCRAGGGQRPAENMRCVEMNTQSQWAPCFLSNVFSVAKQLKTSLLARTALFSACDAILQVRPAEGWVMGMHTHRHAQTQAHVRVHAEGDINTRGLAHTCTNTHTSLKLSQSWQKVNTLRCCSTRHALYEALTLPILQWR